MSSYKPERNLMNNHPPPFRGCGCGKSRAPVSLSPEQRKELESGSVPSTNYSYNSSSNNLSNLLFGESSRNYPYPTRVETPSQSDLKTDKWNPFQQIKQPTVQNFPIPQPPVSDTVNIPRGPILVPTKETAPSEKPAEQVVPKPPAPFGYRSPYPEPVTPRPTSAMAGKGGGCRSCGGR